MASEMLGSAAAPSDGDDGLLLGFGLMVADIVGCLRKDWQLMTLLLSFDFGDG